MSNKPRLITIPFSHFCEKARWALDHTGVAYDEEGHVPVAHAVAVKRAGGKRSVPALVTRHGTLSDSTDILRFADSLASTDRKLYPADDIARRDVDALETSFDEELGPHLRRLLYFHALGRREVTLRLFSVATPRAERLFARALFPAIRAIMRRSMRIDAAGAQRSHDAVRRVFDDVASRLSDGRRYLFGDRFTAADLTFAALASPGLRPDEHPITYPSGATFTPEVAAIMASFRESPGGQFALRMYRDHRRARS